jgi:drug/metabolite transporter (DMT)-like permease
MGWLFLGESLSAWDLAGVTLALAGVAVVVTEPRRPPAGGLSTQAPPANGDGPPPAKGASTQAPPATPAVPPAARARDSYGWGILFACGGAAGQAIGLVTSKLGLAGGFSTLSANLIRILAATVAIWLVTALRGGVGSSFTALRARPRALRPLVAGAVVGPVLGVWLSLLAVQRAPVGVASTLMSLTPVFLIPVGRLVFGEQISRRAVGGTLLALAGTAVLFSTSP